MKIIRPSFEILDEIDGDDILKRIEIAGRTCYKSESNITSDSAKKFVASVIKNGHESVIEHEKITVRIICDRGITHEIVRHRLASYSQESTRYCNYSKDKFDNELTFIRPPFFEKGSEVYQIWLSAMQESELNYLDMIESGVKPEEARTVLPNSLKTEIIVTMNLREWRHFFKVRTADAAHPQMREIARPMLESFKNLIPVVFDDITY
ncbi:FAD-dependent thymidylate synthase [Candidatus Saccharibacteria bacterium]|nr:FAD-dependent thymidylate synthase [Candidatus Saccharibacteria bacterium]